MSSPFSFSCVAFSLGLVVVGGVGFAPGCGGTTVVDPGGTGGAGGSASTSVTQSVAIGGCFDSGGCDVPNADQTIRGCVSCAVSPLSSCAPLFEACRADVNCWAILDCVEKTCGNASCVTSCAVGRESGASVYRALLLCGYCECNSPLDLCQPELDALAPPGSCD